LGIPYLWDVLALEFSKELLEALIVSIDANGAKNTLDVGCGGRSVATKAEEKVSCEMLHFEICVCLMLIQLVLDALSFETNWKLGEQERQSI
jgi:hypothetical protein